MTRRRSDRSLASLLLAQRLVDGEGEALRPREFWALARRIREPATRRAITEGRLCLCTPYKPTAGFSVANAMGRNRLVFALTGATLIVAADEGRGGTWEGAVEALRGRITDVAVWQGAGAGHGNAALVALGARPITSPAALFSAQPKESPEDAKPQLTFDV